RARPTPTGRRANPPTTPRQRLRPRYHQADRLYQLAFGQRLTPVGIADTIRYLAQTTIEPLRLPREFRWPLGKTKAHAQDMPALNIDSINDGTAIYPPWAWDVVNLGIMGLVGA